MKQYNRIKTAAAVLLVLALAILGARSIESPGHVGLNGLSGNDKYTLPLGQFLNATTLTKAFSNSDVDGTVEELAEFMGDTAQDWIVLPSTPSSVWIASTEDEATSEVTIQGTDDSGAYQEIVEDVTGNTPVVLSSKFYRVFRAFISDGNGLGTGEKIYIATDGAFTVGVPDDLDEVQAYITAEHNQALQSGMFIPAEAVGLMSSMVIHVGDSLGTSTTAHIHLEVRPPFGVWTIKWVLNVDRGTHNVTFPEMLLIPTGADIRLSASASAANTAISGGYSLRLLPATLLDSTGYMQ